MKELNAINWIRGVLSLVLISIMTASYAASVITDLYYDLATLSDAELEADWTRHDGGGARGGIQINSFGNSLYYANSNLEIINNNAFLFDAVISGL